MSKVINFNTRDFVFDANCKVNRGFRGFVTTPNGNEEIWEIGDWNWNWTQIITVLTGLEPDTDYVFRFAMTLGHNDDNREESLVNIFPAVPDADPYDSRSEDHPERLREAAARQKAWDARYTYCIRQSRFQPVISKRDPLEDTMIRVFELPFRTDSHTDWKVMFVAQHAVARFFRAKDNEAYADLEDLTYEQWREQRTKTLEAEREAALSKAASGLPEGLREAMSFQGGVPELPEKIRQAIEIADGISDDFGDGPRLKGALNLRGAIIRSESQFDKLLKLAANGMAINLSGAVLDYGDGDDDEDEDEDDEDEDFDEDDELDEDDDLDEE